MGSSILITGGAGSLGKEFVRLLHKTHEITVVDNNEWAVAELRSEFPDLDIRLADFDHFKSNHDYVIHCAAYKHVNLGEENTASFIQNNLIKTMRFYQNVSGQILYISTDKAVEPISAYGMTKALAEKLTWDHGGQVARCGNFLNSSGSVIPVWEKQIAEGKPLTITDERMTRYVLEMDRAVDLIWTRFLLGERLIVPVLGEPVGLKDLAKTVLERHGKDDTYPIEIIGMRPGEKLHEKLKWEWE